VMVVLQALDAGGKDCTVNHVLTAGPAVWPSADVCERELEWTFACRRQRLPSSMLRGARRAASISAMTFRRQRSGRRWTGYAPDCSGIVA